MPLTNFFQPSLSRTSFLISNHDFLLPSLWFFSNYLMVFLLISCPEDSSPVPSLWYCCLVFCVYGQSSSSSFQFHLPPVPALFSTILIIAWPCLRSLLRHMLIKMWILLVQAMAFFNTTNHTTKLTWHLNRRFLVLSSGLLLLSSTACSMLWTLPVPLQLLL